MPDLDTRSGRVTVIRRLWKWSSAAISSSVLRGHSRLWDWTHLSMSGISSVTPMGVSWTLWNPFRHVICARSARWFIFGGQAAGPQGRCSFPCGLPRNRPSTRSRRRPVRPRSCKGRTRTAGRGTVRSVPRRLMSAIFPLPEAGSAVLRSPTAPRASRLQAALRSLRTGSMRRIVSAPAEGKTRDAAAAFPM